MIDWLTLASFGKQDYKIFRHLMAELVADGVGLRQDSSIPRYTGWRVSHPVDGGSVFVGSGIQKQKAHFVMVASGGISHPVALKFMPMRLQGRPTRVDLQVTVEMPDGWKQTELWRHSEDNDIPASLAGVHPVLRTVYIGSPHSSRFHRVYVKESDAGYLLRLEIVFREELAQAAWLLLKNGRTERQIMRGAMPTLPMLESCFGAVLAGEGVKVRRSRPVTNTEKWLLTQVLPALRKYINSHDANPEVMTTMAEILARHNGWNDAPS